MYRVLKRFKKNERIEDMLENVMSGLEEHFPVKWRNNEMMIDNNKYGGDNIPQNEYIKLLYFTAGVMYGSEISQDNIKQLLKRIKR